MSNRRPRPRDPIAQLVELANRIDKPLEEFVAEIDRAPEPERSAWHWQRGRQCQRTRPAMIAAYEAREP